MGEPKASLLSLIQLRCFVATVQASSFTGAAQLLGVSQPAVAEQIRNLERSLEIDLFVRAGRGVRLTPAGEALAERIPVLLESLEDAISSVDEVRAVQRGVLAFGMFATPEAYSVDRVAAEFVRRHPEITLRLVGHNSSAAADRVRVGELEAALVTLPIDDHNLTVTPIARDEVVYVSASAASTAKPLSIETLGTRQLILYDAESGNRDPLRRQLLERAQEYGAPLAPRVETQTMVMALRFASAGVGDTYVPRAHTAAPTFPANLLTTPFEPPVPETFAIVRRRGGRLSPATREFVQQLSDHMRSLPGLEAL